MRRQVGWMRLTIWGGGAILCFIFTLIATISIGSAQLSFLTVWNVMLYQLSGHYLFVAPTSYLVDIVWFVRLPRVLLAGMVGAVLALSGLIFQGLLRNPLADPFVLGVSSGAAAGAALSIFFGLENIWLSAWTTPVAAMCGAWLAIAVVLFLARSGHTWGQERLILAGMIVQAFFGAVISMTISLSKSEIQRIVYWLMGSFAMRDWSHLFYVSIFFLVGLVIALLWSRELNLLALGDRAASQLGVRVQRTRLVLVIVASVMTAVAVSVSGTIGFVGLVVPHLLRFLFGADHRLLLPLSICYGAAFLMWADCLARTLFSPMELPISVVTAFIGVPFFAYLLRRHSRQAEFGRRFD